MGPRRRRGAARVVAVTLAALIAGVACAGPAAAGAGEPRAPGSALPRTRRLLIVSLPAVSWSDLRDHRRDLPHLTELAAASRVADLSTRTPGRQVDLASGYVVIGAGARGDKPSGDGGLLFGASERLLVDAGAEPVAGTSAAPPGPTAGEVFTRRTGRLARPGAIVDVSLAALLDRNGKLLYGARIGATGDALEKAGVRRAVIANADQPGPETGGGLDTYQRGAGRALSGPDGTVPAGRVDSGLLEADPDAPFGVRYDVGAVAAAFDDVWRRGEDRVAVVVEASDLARADAYRPFVTSSRRDVLVARALRWTDELVGRLLRSVDPSRDAVMLVTPAVSKARGGLGVAAVRAPGAGPGLLESSTTRRPGFVQLTDVAPTILGFFGIPVPSSMEGRPFEASGSGGGDASARVDRLVDEEAAGLFRDRMLPKVSTAFVLAIVVMSLGTVAAFQWPRRGAFRLLEWLALGMLGVLTATWLAALVPLHRSGPGAYWAFLVGTGVTIAGVALVSARRFWFDPVMVVLAFVVAVFLGDVVTGSNLQWNTVFGHSPTVAGRFYGIDNSTFALVSAAAVLLAGLVAHRVGGRRGAWYGIGLLVVLLVVDGLPIWGADAGGILALVPTVLVTGWLLLGYRVRPRRVLAALGAAVVAFAVVGFLDLARPPDRRTHLGRLFEKLVDGDFGGFADVILRKLDLLLATINQSMWTLMLPVVFAFLAYLVYRAPGRLQLLQHRIPELRSALAGLLVLGFLGFAVNDSGISIPAIMLGVLDCVLVFLLAREWRTFAGPGTDPSDGEPGHRTSRPATDPSGAEPVVEVGR